MKMILLVSPSGAKQSALRTACAALDFHLDIAETVGTARAVLERTHSYDAILLDYEIGNDKTASLIPKYKEAHRKTKFVAFSSTHRGLQRLDGCSHEIDPNFHSSVIQRELLELLG